MSINVNNRPNKDLFLGQVRSKQNAGKNKKALQQYNRSETPVNVQLSSMASNLLDKAAQLYETQDEVRPESVQSAKQAVKNWKGLNDEQLEKIAEGILGDFS